MDDKSRVAVALKAVALNGDRKAEAPIDIEERVAEEKRRSITAVEKKDARVLEIFIPNYVETRVFFEKQCMSFCLALLYCWVVSFDSSLSPFNTSYCELPIFFFPLEF